MRTRSQAASSARKRSASPDPAPPPKKAAVAKDPPGAATQAAAPPPQEGSAVQSSIPGMSIADIRAILGQQRKQFQEKGYVALTDEVYPNMSRLEFDFRYVYGIALKRHAKHKRASARQPTD